MLKEENSRLYAILFLLVPKNRQIILDHIQKNKNKKWQTSIVYVWKEKKMYGSIAPTWLCEDSLNIPGNLEFYLLVSKNHFKT